MVSRHSDGEMRTESSHDRVDSPIRQIDHGEIVKSTFGVLYVAARKPR